MMASPLFQIQSVSIQRHKNRLQRRTSMDGDLNKRNKKAGEDSNNDRSPSLDTNRSRSTDTEILNQPRLLSNPILTSNDRAEEGIDEKEPHKDNIKPKKSTNAAMLQPMQRNRKRSREKKRRQGITAAMAELHDILAKINMDESRRIHMPTTHLEEQYYVAREQAPIMTDTSNLASNLMGFQQLGQREIIVDAVNTLSHLHSENERHKAEILQLTTSLLSLQQGPVNMSNTAMMPPFDANFVSCVVSSSHTFF